MVPLLLPALLLAGLDLSVLTVPIAHADTYDFTSTSTVRAYIDLMATTTPKRALYVAEHESAFVHNQRGDMVALCRNKNSPYFGEPITARGVWQITRCYHWEITDEQADDVVWSTAWALPRIADRQTCMKEWTTCRQYLKQL